VEGRHAAALGLIRAMAGQGRMSLRAAARFVGQDVKTVHGAAEGGCSLKKDEAGRNVFPRDAVYVGLGICHTPGTRIGRSKHMTPFHGAARAWQKDLGYFRR
jgi:hypothetical protein